MIKIHPHDLRAGDVVDYHGELHTVAHIDQELAMAYGDEFQLSQVMAADLALFAEHAGIDRSVLVREMRRLGRASAAAAAAQLAEATYSDEERAFLQPLAAFVEQQAARFTELAPVIAASASRATRAPAPA